MWICGILNVDICCSSLYIELWMWNCECGSLDVELCCGTVKVDLWKWTSECGTLDADLWMWMCECELDLIAQKGDISMFLHMKLKTSQ